MVPLMVQGPEAGSDDYTTGLETRNALLLGNKVRARRRLAVGAGLALGTVLIAGIGVAAVTGSTPDHSTVQPITAATPTPAATSVSPQTRFALSPEVKGEGDTYVTMITDRTVGEDAPVQPGLQVMRSPDETTVPETVTRSTGPVYVREQISGAMVWIEVPPEQWTGG